MSILIENMKMPKGCAGCRFCWVDMNDRFCIITGKFDINKYYQGKHPNCPINKEIPDKHGRLGDLDEIYAYIDYICKYCEKSCSTCDVSWIKKVISEAPTIIEASK